MIALEQTVLSESHPIKRDGFRRTVRLKHPEGCLGVLRAHTRTLERKGAEEVRSLEGG